MTTEDRLAQVLADWRERLDRGEQVTQERILRDHPDLAAELRVRFAALGDLAAALRHVTGASSAGLPALRKLAPDRYQGFRPVGQGGMGIVYWALDTDLNRAVAFKVVRPTLATDAHAEPPPQPLAISPPERDTPASLAFETLRRRFLQEAWVTGAMEHPGILPVYEVGETPEGVPFYTMRFVRGERTLAHAIADAQEAPVEQRLGLLEPFLKVCDALRYAHAQGVVHRDLKPSNVALGEFGEVVVLDWGLAKVGDGAGHQGPPEEAGAGSSSLGASFETRGLGWVGTPGYMSPEAARGQAPIDARADVYSLGVILFEILTGVVPRWNESEDPWTPVAGLDERLVRACRGALAPDPGARTPSVHAFADEIRSWQQATARERELDAADQDARRALDAAETAQGDARLAALDRAAAACTRALGILPSDPRARVSLAKVDELRRSGLEERVQEARRRFARRFAVVALVLGVLAASVVTAVFDHERRRANEAEATAVAESLARAEALRRVQALALASAAQGEITSDPQRALLLAREAYRRQACPETIEALHAALGAPAPLTMFRLERAPGAENDPRLLRGAIAPGGDRYVLGADDGRVVEVAQDGKELRRARLHQGAARYLGYAGEDIVSAGDDGALLRWKPGAEAVEIARLPPPITAFARARRGGGAAAGSGKGTVAMIDLATGATVTLGAEGPAVRALCMSPDASLVFAAYQDGRGKVWSAQGELRADFPTAVGDVHTAVFHPDGRRLLVGGSNATACLCDLDGRLLATFRGHQGAVTRALFFPSGDGVLTTSEDRRVFLWDMEGHRNQALGPFEYPASSARISPGGDFVLVAVAFTSDVLVYGSDGVLRTRLGGHKTFISGCDISADSRRVLTIDWGSTARYWSPARRELAEWRAHDGIVWAVAASPQGNRIVTASTDRTARIWDDEGSPVAVLSGHQADVEYAAYSPDGRRIVTASEDGTARVWDADGSPRHVLTGAERGVRMASFSADGRLVGAASWDGRTRLYDEAGRLVATVGRKDCAIAWCAISPTEPRIATACLDGWARIYDMDGKEVARLEANAPHRTWCVDYSPDGKKLLTSGEGGRVVLHDLVTGRRVTVMGDMRSAGARFLPDGAHFVTGGTLGTARVWDLEGTLVFALHAHEGGMEVTADPSGRRLLTAGRDGMVRQWLLREDDLLRLAGERITRTFDDGERRRYGDLLGERPAGDGSPPPR